MASLITGFEYDIFISYRQKDNKGDRWVSEFVEALKTELESTFKEEISVYFDINPHDGLSETHDVDASLKDKLKCLVFIPVISRTYCDPKSFAWEHEFRAFAELASQDKFGLKVRLPNGNVAGRILPVKIHDLDPEDKELLEHELGGYLRCIEFIYKSAGVNRPLRTNEDHPSDNINRTYYRDQINKVANAAKEIITTIKKHDDHDVDVPKEVAKGKLPKLKSRIILGSFLVPIFIIMGYFFVPTILNSPKTVEKSIAVLPFINDSQDTTYVYFINGIMEGILDNLSKIKELKVLSRTSVEQYRNNKTKTTPQIAKELGVNYIVEGSGQKDGDQVKLSIQLIDARSDKHILSEPYTRKMEEIFSLQSEITTSVANRIKAVITPEEAELIEKKPTKNLAALNMYLRGDDLNRVAQLDNNKDLFHAAEIFLKKAIQLDSTFAAPYVPLGWIVISSRNNLDSALLLANRSIHFEVNNPDAYGLKGWILLNSGLYKEAEDVFKLAIKFNPNDAIGYSLMGDLFWLKCEYPQTIEYKLRALQLEKEPYMRSLNLSGLCYYLYGLGFYGEGLKYAEELVDYSNDSSIYFKGLMDADVQRGDYHSAFKYAMKMKNWDPNVDLLTPIDICLYLRDFKEALKYVEEYCKMAEKQGTQMNPLGMLGFVYLINGQKEKSVYHFEGDIRNLLNIIEQNKQNPGVWNYLNLVANYSAMGDKSKAMEYLREAKKCRDISITSGNIPYLKNYPMFDRIRDETEYQEFIKNAENRWLPVQKKIKKILQQETGRTMTDN